MKLTLPQQDVYFEQLLYTNDPIYNIGAKIVIDGPIIYEILNGAYKGLINQHDAFRTRIFANEDQVSFEIQEGFEEDLKFLDFSYMVNANEEAISYMDNSFAISFDLTKNELLHEFVLIKVSDTFYYLFSKYHHIITDGWGTSLMFQRLVKNYNELLDSNQLLSSYPYSYTNFVSDDRLYENSEDFKKDESYWIDRFKTLPKRFLEKNKINKGLNESKRQDLYIKRETYSKLEKIAESNNCSTFHVILGVFYLYFSKKHEINDFAIGLPVLNRGKSMFKKTVGLFMGVSALRMKIDSEFTFEELIKEIKSQLRKDYRHQRFPMGKIVQKLKAFEEKDRIYNVTLSYEKQNYSDHFRNTSTRVIPMTHKSERVALAVYIREFDKDEDVKVDFDYNLNYFDNYTVSQVVKHFEKLIHEVIKYPNSKLNTFNFLTNEEEELLDSFNQTDFEYPKKETFLSIVKERAKEKPDKIAIRDEYNSYSFEDLEYLSDAIAESITKLNIEKSPIAVLMPRSAKMLVTFLGVLKSGNSYIPLDPEFPEKRLNYILEHSGASYVLGTKETKKENLTHSHFLDVEEFFIKENSFKVFKSSKIIAPNETAYIIYTSGSTGNPKGVEISHKSLLNFLISIRNNQNFTSEDVLFSVTTQSFDISILEFYAPLISGASVYIANKRVLNEPKILKEKIKEVGTTLIQGTPSFYQFLLNSGWQGNRNIKALCGGDLLSNKLTSKLLENFSEVWNMYGPTETTIWSSAKKIEKEDDANNIGKPINNTKFFILNKNLERVSIGILGSIYIGGDGLAKGYYKNKELSEKKFIISPFNAKERIYETGDMGKWNKEGEIFFHGRNDFQVKVRGYRIETGEIECKLNELEKIGSSVVLAKELENQESYLIAFVSLKRGVTLDTKTIKEKLRETLPEYMIPSMILKVDEFPLTPNNKVDRKKLLSLEVNHKIIKEEIGIETEMTNKLNEYFRLVLGLKRKISLQESFFSLGGHSINAVRLSSIIEKELNVNVSLKDIFNNSTIQKLSLFIENQKEGKANKIPLTEEKDNYPLTFPQYSIWLASQNEAISKAYNMNAVYEIFGDINKSALESSLKKLIEKYEILRTNFIEINGEPRQKINLEKEFHLEEKKIIEEEINDFILDYVNREFKFEKDVLIRGVILNTTARKYFIFSGHHLILDGWSMEVLIKEILTNYKSNLVGANSNQEKLPIQFKDYSVWQENIEKKNIEKRENYWKEYLNGYSWKSIIPQKNGIQSGLNKADEFSFKIDLEQKIIISDYLKEQELTLHSFLVGAFNILLYKLYNHTDVCIGVVNSGRGKAELNNQLGMFVKTLPQRTGIDEKKSINNFLKEIQYDLLKEDDYQNLPEIIYKDLNFEVLIAIQAPSFNYSSIEVTSGLTLKEYQISSSYTRVPLLLNFIQNSEGIIAKFEYNEAIYERNTIELLALRYKALIANLISNTDTIVDKLDACLEFEKEPIIDIEFNF
ncbi:non-ribosomal peptide synthetase [Tenacibaculum singaporense]|uniref:non-ribosomal peptide synthetase n=1 Tax=Tenacibaculum singaporense TaxID=2358479 RepID=UPI000F6918DB|nr:non-ribosomal peptide synthetase [Tenacibaculum singaporense]RSC93307.1 amino acid adenylation domain-containing protein [Tenacibaculum singaporense]